MANSVIVSINPNSGASDQRRIAETLIDQLSERGFKVLVPSNLDELKTLTRRETDGGRLRVVVACGGDGTVALLLNELPAGTPLTVLPLGTENLLAKYLGLTAEPSMLATIIEQGLTASIDVGRANGTFFMVMASCGFDADVVRRLHAVRKGHINHWSYARPIVDAIRRYRYPRIRITVDNEAQPRIESKWAFVFNVPRYAMNLPIVDDADPQDGSLDLCTFRGGNLLLGLLYFGGVVMRQHRRWRDCNFEKFRKIRLESDERVPYQLDGDPGGELPLEIEVVPAYLKVMVAGHWIQENEKKEPIGV